MKKADRNDEWGIMACVILLLFTYLIIKDLQAFLPVIKYIRIPVTIHQIYISWSTI